MNNNVSHFAVNVLTRKTVCTVVFSAVNILCCTYVHASIVRIQFSGIIDYVENGLPFGSAIEPGSLFSGTYSYDSTVPDNVPNDPSAGGYSFPDHSMSVQVGSLTFTTPDLGISITNMSIFDLYDVGNASPFSAHGIIVRSMGIALGDLTATAFDSDALPETAPRLEDFAIQHVFYIIGAGHREAIIEGQLSSLELIPEPNTCVLLASASLLALTRRRVKRHNAPR